MTTSSKERDVLENNLQGYRYLNNSNQANKIFRSRSYEKGVVDQYSQLNLTSIPPRAI